MTNRFIYNSQNVIAIYQNDESVTYTLEKVLIDTIPNAKVYFDSQKINYSNFSELEDLNNLWHESGTTIRVRMAYDDNINLLTSYPEMGVYRKTNNITLYIDGYMVFFYLNYMLDEHKTLLLQYNAIITDNSIPNINI